QAAQEEARQAALEEDRKAQLAEQHDARELAMYVNGIVPGAALARSQAMADLQGEISGYREQIEKLERRLERLQGQARDEAEAVSRSAAMASRSAPVDPVGAAVYRAQETVREYQAQLRAEAAAQAVVRSAGRPKGRGAAVRSEPVTCPHCLKLQVT